MLELKLYYVIVVKSEARNGRTGFWFVLLLLLLKRTDPDPLESLKSSTPESTPTALVEENSEEPLNPEGENLSTILSLFFHYN